MARRQHLSLTVVGALFVLGLLTLFMSSKKVPALSPFAADSSSAASDVWKADAKVPESILKGGSIAPKLENATAKYGL